MMAAFRRKLPTGIKRALIVASVVWMVGYYLTHKEAIDFSLTAGASTPSTMCSDVYPTGDDRLFACEAAGPYSWSDMYLKRQRGEKVEVPFDYYQNAHHNFSVWYWLLGVPLALFVLAYAGRWVVAGFKEDRRA
jgi:hypothetical protein